jgi:hypothetical protein
MRGLWALIGLVVGCTSVDIMRLTSDAYPPRSADDRVEVLLDSGGRAYSEIAVIKLAHSGNDAWYQLLARAQLEARRLGADAIIVTSGGTYDLSKPDGVGAPGAGGRRDQLEATAVVYQHLKPTFGPSRSEGDETPELPAASTPSRTANFRCEGTDPIRGEVVTVLPDSAEGESVTIVTRGGTEVRVEKRCVSLER